MQQDIRWKQRFQNKQITDVLTEFSEIEEALIFGSRALKSYKPGLDIDMVLKNTHSCIIYAK